MGYKQFFKKINGTSFSFPVFPAFQIRLYLAKHIYQWIGLFVFVQLIFVLFWIILVLFFSFFNSGCLIKLPSFRRWGFRIFFLPHYCFYCLLPVSKYLEFAQYLCDVSHGFDFVIACYFRESSYLYTIHYCFCQALVGYLFMCTPYYIGFIGIDVLD